jgi:hypothetical protein
LARCSSSAAAPPASRLGGSGSSGPAPQDQGQAARGSSRSALRSGATPDGTPRAASGRSQLPGSSTSAGHLGRCAPRRATPRSPPPKNHTVRLPRARRPASYSVQLVTRCRCLGIWCRRSALVLNGMAGVPCGRGLAPRASLPGRAQAGDPCNKLPRRLNHASCGRAGLVDIETRVSGGENLSIGWRHLRPAVIL